MNSLEHALLTGAIKAHKRYSAMSGGYWLWHAPEAFTQITVAQEINRTGYHVYVDASVKKSRADCVLSPPRGRPSTYFRKRPDISVWHKSSNTLRAVIEIKHAWSTDVILRDRQKLANFLSKRFTAKAGYILAYSESKGDNRVKTLGRRFRRWARDLSWRIVAIHLGTPSGADSAWGFCLLRSPTTWR